MKILLTHEIKFCCEENIEQHLWKILYYDTIELLRNFIMSSDCEDKILHKKFVMQLISDGCTYYEDLLIILEKKYQFNLEDYIGSNSGGKRLK